MKKTGHTTPSLTERLQETATRQREEIEGLIQAELQKLAASLRQSSTDALSGFENDMRTSLAEIQREVTRKTRQMKADLEEIRDHPRRMIFASVLITAVVTALFWSGPRLWMAWRLSPVHVETNSEGRFLILPESAQVGWSCGGASCVKLGE